MNWLNLHTAVLDSPEFIGSAPTERATWLCLLHYCTGQENGGRITGCRQWKDRKWQQLIRVTMREAQSECDLWEWDGDDIVVAYYPAEKQEEVQQMRRLGKTTTQRKAAAARENGSKGGRPKTQRETQREETETNPTETHRKEVEGKGKELEREPQARDGDSIFLDAPCTFDEAWAHAQLTPPSEGLNWQRAAVDFWWTKRESKGWRDFAGRPVKKSNWKADMKDSARWAHDEVRRLVTPPRERKNGKQPRELSRMEQIEIQSTELS